MLVLLKVATPIANEIALLTKRALFFSTELTLNEY